MEKVAKNCSELLSEITTDPDVFRNMACSQPINEDKFDLSLRFQFPKFSKNYDLKVFDTFIKENIGKENLVSLGRLSYPNEFQMELKSKKVREKLIRMAKIQIEGRSCWISPLSQSEIRGFIHWLPTAVNNDKIKVYLEPFGDVLFIENQKTTKWDLTFESDSRYFALKLKPGKTKDDINHFILVESYRALITIRGRNPVCFHCKESGHRKSECRQYREKLNSYSRRQPKNAETKRLYRGKRHKSDSDKSSNSAAKDEKPKSVAKDEMSKSVAKDEKCKTVKDEKSLSKEGKEAKPATSMLTLAELQKLSEQMQHMQLTIQMATSTLQSEEAEKAVGTAEGATSGVDQKKKKKKKKKKSAAKPSENQSQN